MHAEAVLEEPLATGHLISIARGSSIAGYMINDLWIYSYALMLKRTFVANIHALGLKHMHWEAPLWRLWQWVALGRPVSVPVSSRLHWPGHKVRVRVGLGNC